MANKSAVWLNMTRINDRQVKCTFNRCGRIFENRKGSSTTPLRVHLQGTHKIIVPKLPASGSKRRASETEEDVDDLTAEKEPGEGNQNGGGAATTATAGGASSASRSSRLSSFQGPLDQCVNNVNAFARGGKRDEEVTDALLYMIAKDNMPLSTTERKGFRVFVKKLQPLYKLPSEPTITKLLGVKHGKLKEAFARNLAAASTIILTLDIWTQRGTMRSFLGVTVHFPLDGCMISAEIEAVRLTERKTIAYLRSVIQGVCREWSIKHERVKAVITDGGANIKGAVKQEFPGKHLSCFAHILDNVGQKTLRPNAPYTVPSERPDDQQPDPDLPDRESDVEDDETEDEVDNSLLGALVKQVKKTVRFFRQSEVATSELVKLQMEEKQIPESKALKLIQEVKTRWNSRYEMIDRYLTLHEYVSRVILKIQLNKNSKSKPPEIISAEDIEALGEVRDLLKPLAIATKEVSVEQFPTLSKCIPIIRVLKESINRVVAATPVGFNLKVDLQNRIKTSFGKIEGIKMYGYATLLDPRFKKLGFTDAQAASNAVAGVSEKIRRNMETSLETQQNDEVPDNAAEGAGDPDDFWGSIDQEARQAASGQAAGSAAGYVEELKAYLSAPPLDRKANPNPLKAWDQIKHLYPNVYKVAMEYLPILCTSVPCERLFSHAGNIATQLRNRLAGSKLSQLIFLRGVSDELWFSVG